MEGKPENSDQGDDLLMLARERDLDALEAAWMRRLEREPRDMETLFRVAAYLVKRKFSDRAALLLWSLVAAVAEQGDTACALEVAKRAASIAPEAESLREEVISLYRTCRSDVAELDAILTASGICAGADIQDAVRRIEYGLRLRPGAFVIHVRSRRVGRVVEVADGRYVIEGDGDRHGYSIEEAAAVWEALAAEDFRGLAAFEPERLRRLAKDDPVRLVEMILRACKGAADFKQLKHRLIPDVLAADEWSAWWNGVKVALKRSPKLEIAGASQPRFALRTEGGDYSGKFRAQFDAATDPCEKVKQALEYLAEVEAGHEGDAGLAEHLAASLLQAGRDATDPAVALATLACAQEVYAKFPSGPGPGAELLERAGSVSDAAALLASIPGDEVARLVLNTLRTACPERWPQIYADAFLSASLRLCDLIARELLASDQPALLRAAVQKTIALPEQSAESFGWVWRRLLTANDAITEGLNPVGVTASLLHLMNRLARTPRHAKDRSEARRKLGKLRNLIGTGQLRLLKGLIAGTDPVAARRLHDAIIANEGLAEHATHDLIEALRARHPQEFIEQKKLWEDGHIYSTLEGLARRQADLEKLVNENMRRNAEAIGAAAARGDLRENWEYKAALEERDRLVERAQRAREDLDLARAITADPIPDGEVNVGTAVRLRDPATGAERTVIFLGPWDADIDGGVYSYLAPLSLRFMGKRVGDRVRASLDDAEREFEIVGIEKIV